MEATLKKVAASKIPMTLSEQIQALEVNRAIEIPTSRRVGAMSIITYWKRVGKFSERKFKSRKKDETTCYIIRVS